MWNQIIIIVEVKMPVLERACGGAAHSVSLPLHSVAGQICANGPRERAQLPGGYQQEAGWDTGRWSHDCALQVGGNRGL